MRFGFVLPFGDAREVAECAAAAEAAGWDALLVWEAVFGVDAWVALTAAAMVTERIRVGTMLTPVPRVKPWDLASRVGTLDRLSRGRVILGAGLGALHEGWTAFEPDEGRAVRVGRLEECLDVYAGLLRGQPFAYQGRYYSADPTDFMLPDPPVQRPHPPVWVVGAHDYRRPAGAAQPSVERAARWQGWLPQVVDENFRGRPRSPEELAALTVDLLRHRADLGIQEPIDVCFEGSFYGATDGDAVGRDVRAWQQAGATWWVEGAWELPRGTGGAAEVRRRIEVGPPVGTGAGRPVSSPQ